MLVKDGWCWWYRKYAPGDTALEEQEAEAPEAKKGLWADPQPVPPWEWRKRKERYLLASACVALSGVLSAPGAGFRHFSAMRTGV
jgi:hypothetical protein